MQIRKKSSNRNLKEKEDEHDYSATENGRKTQYSSRILYGAIFIALASCLLYAIKYHNAKLVSFIKSFDSKNEEIIKTITPEFILAEPPRTENHPDPIIPRELVETATDSDDDIESENLIESEKNKDTDNIVQNTTTPEDFFSIALSRMHTQAEERLKQITKDTKTADCAKKIIDAFEEHHRRFALELHPLYEVDKFKTDCVPTGQETQQVPRGEPETINLLFGVLIHENPSQAIRLIKALQHPLHSFVVHVDYKETSEETYATVKKFSEEHSNIHIMDQNRVSISWGGWNVVQATLNIMKHALELNLPFDWFINLSGYSYPLTSSLILREELAKYPSNANFMEIRPSKFDPSIRAWHYFEECDDKLHRITRLAKPHDIAMAVGSQWFTVSRDFVEYVGKEVGFAGRYKVYAQHLVVADENYFQTVLTNSPMCESHVNENFHHIQFDEWEHAKDNPNPSKCLQPNPKHCGRSPATITIDYIPVLEHSNALFARKFDERVDSKILDYLDDQIQKTSAERFSGSMFENVQLQQTYSIRGQLHQLCLEVPNKAGGEARMTVCNKADPNQVFRIGPCSSDGEMNFQPGKCMNSTVGRFMVPFCQLQSANGNCLDLEGESKESGGKLISYPCTFRWNQLFGFGADKRTCQIFMNVPNHYVLANPDRIQRELCLEVQHARGLAINTAICKDDAQTNHFQKFMVSPV